MAEANNSGRFMEEVQKYENLYNKFSHDCKDKYMRVNCLNEIREKSKWMQRKQKRNKKAFEPQISAFDGFFVVFSGVN